MDYWETVIYSIWDLEGGELGRPERETTRRRVDQSQAVETRERLPALSNNKPKRLGQIGIHRV